MNDPIFYADKEQRLLKLANSHFGSDLTPAEFKLLRNSVRPGVPEAPKDSRGENLPPEGRLVRPELLRWIMVDSDASSLIDINGIWVMNATIRGSIDLGDCSVAFGLSFYNCILTGVLGLDHATVERVTLYKCSLLEEFDALVIKCKGSVLVVNCKLEGRLSLFQATVGEVRIERSMLLKGMSGRSQL